MSVKTPRIPLPRSWPAHVKAAILHVISLARATLVAARARTAQSPSMADRLRAELDAAEQEIALLREELRLKDLRMARVPSHRRPHFRPVERLAVLELRSARGWSKRETARRFLLGPATVVSWMRRLDDGGPQALLRTPEPVNRFPDFVRLIVKRLKVLCPTMGKKRIAEVLTRAGLALGVSTVARMIKEDDPDRPEAGEVEQTTPDTGADPSGRAIHAHGPHQVWQVDLTVVPTAAGFWTAWFPFALPSLWPFSWHLACIVEQFSRRVLDVGVFTKEPTSLEIRCFLGRVMGRLVAQPKYLVSDKGTQFDCHDYRAWCQRRGIRPRYASTGSLRATAVVERFIRSLKDEWLRLRRVPLRRDTMRRDVRCYLRWFEAHRPHQGLGGRTPREVFDDKRDEPASLRLDHPIELVVRYHEGCRELPIVELKSAA